MGAVFGLNYGWEHPLWFAPEGVEPQESYGFTRQPWFDHVGAEAKALRDGVGVIDISNFAKYRITGAGAGDWLDRVVANRVPTQTGRSCLTPLIGGRGGIAGDFTITKLGEDDFFMVGSGMAERYHQRYFNAVPRPATVDFSSATVELCGRVRTFRTSDGPAGTWSGTHPQPFGHRPGNGGDSYTTHARIYGPTARKPRCLRFRDR